MCNWRRFDFQNFREEGRRHLIIEGYNEKQRERYQLNDGFYSWTNRRMRNTRNYRILRKNMTGRHAHGNRARICKRLWSPGIDSEESIPPAYVAWRAGTTNRVLYRPVRLGIDSRAPLKVYKYGLCTWVAKINNLLNYLFLKILHFKPRQFIFSVVLLS